MSEQVEKMIETFVKYDDDFLIGFEAIENKFSNRPDLHAFMLLDKIMPGNRDMVSGAAHEEIFLEVDLSELSKVITEEQIRELVRCGVRFSEDNECLAMFV